MRKKGKYSVFRIANPNIHRGWIANPAQLTPAQLTPAQTLLPIRTAFLGLVRPERGQPAVSPGQRPGYASSSPSALQRIKALSCVGFSCVGFAIQHH